MNDEETARYCATTLRAARIAGISVRIVRDDGEFRCQWLDGIVGKTIEGERRLTKVAALVSGCEALVEYFNTKTHGGEASPSGESYREA